MGDSAPAPAAAPQAQRKPSLRLPVAELVGLRFSVVHLRLVGYGLIGVWFSELAGLFTAPLLMAVATRLHYISQALDLSPLLLVGLGLVAFQGGLQRSQPERRLLPFLFGLLPLLSALHFVMAPASIANALTLSSKQMEVSRGQLRTIEGQLDRAGEVLRSSADLEDLRRRLDAIPGVRVNASPDRSLAQTRREVAELLQSERRRVRAQIALTASQARDQFTRRAVQNSSLALLIGMALVWLRASALEEMNLSATYLAWVLVADPETGRSGTLKDLLAFQRNCLATSYFTLAERFIRFASRPLRREEEKLEEQIEKDLLERLQLTPPETPPPPPWEPSAARLRTSDWRRSAGLFRGTVAEEPLSEDPEELAKVWEHYAQQEPSARERRRQERDRERVRIAIEQFARIVSDYEGYGERDQEQPKEPRHKGPSPRQLRKAREALERFARQFEENLEGIEDPAAAADPLGFDRGDPELQATSPSPAAPQSGDPGSEAP